MTLTKCLQRWSEISHLHTGSVSDAQNWLLQFHIMPMIMHVLKLTLFLDKCLPCPTELLQLLLPFYMHQLLCKCIPLWCRTEEKSSRILSTSGSSTAHGCLFKYLLVPMKTSVYLCSVATLQGGLSWFLKILHMQYSGVHTWCIVVVAQCISMDVVRGALAPGIYE